MEKIIINTLVPVLNGFAYLACGYVTVMSVSPRHAANRRKGWVKFIALNNQARRING